MSSSRPPERSTSSRAHSSSAYSSSSSSSRYYHEEDRLGRAWRTLASSVVMSFQKAEKVVANPSKDVLKELDEAVVTFLRTRVEWGRQISLIEAKLQGKAQETETLDCYLRSQPRLGRKRKREEDTTAKDTTNELITGTTGNTGIDGVQNEKPAGEP